VLTPLPRNPELEHAALSDYGNHDAWRVYADWLQSQGDPRGELIILSIDSRHGYLSQRRDMLAKLDPLLRDEQRAWSDWAKQVGAGALEFEFDRGLVRGVKGTLAKLGPQLDTLFELAPLHELTLSHCKPADLLELFGRAPAWLARLTELKFEASPKIDGKSLAALARNPLPELDGINLTACEIGSEACEALAKLDTRKLRRMILTANEIDGEALDALLAADHRTQWRRLYLTQNPLDGEALARLAAAEGLDALEGLFLRDIEAEFDDFAPFAAATSLPGLRVLELRRTSPFNKKVLASLTQRFGKGLRVAI
jgi:uncharacterized protein (TIGR02996 family)